MTAAGIPPRAGLGLKPEHYREIIEEKPAVGFFEIHAENYMGAGGVPHQTLERIRRDYPLSLHGVGLSIGGERPLDRDHLKRLRALGDRYDPGLFSEHLAWSSHEVGFLADLLPLPYTAETLTRACDHIDETQEAMGRQMLLENPSSYLAFAESTFTEGDFIAEVARRTGCGLLLDVNNVFISAHNLGFEPSAYLKAYPCHLVQEIHLAGHTVVPEDDAGQLLIDDHASPVKDEVWQLFDAALTLTGPVPALIERDGNVPLLKLLLAEAALAQRALEMAERRRAA